MSRALWQKLGYRPDTVAFLDGAPPGYAASIAGHPTSVVFTESLDDRPSLAHLFVTERAGLPAALAVTADAIPRDGAIWVSWPKASSGVETDVTGDAVRAAGAPFGLVDVKVCAVDPTWTALKLVVRRALR